MANGDRLGIKAEDGSVKKWPKLYIDGTDFSKDNDEAPTTVGVEGRYFVVAPVGSGSFLPFLTRESLVTEIKEFEKEWNDKKKKVGDETKKDEKGTDA